MIIRIADFEADFAHIHAVRTTVFIAEQRVPAALEFDERDRACVQLLAFAGDVPIGTGRIDLERGGKIGRVAVLAAHRRSGVGTALMERFHDIARAHDLTQVWCNAQTSAAAFYEGLGYQRRGDLFDEAGIEHVRMERPL